jgi:hypothetical protein
MANSGGHFPATAYAALLYLLLGQIISRLFGVKAKMAVKATG